MVALGTDVHLLLQIGREDRLPTAGALGEHPRGDAALLAVEVVVGVALEPGHAGWRLLI
jgi:hypothetical protein